MTPAKLELKERGAPETAPLKQQDFFLCYFESTRQCNLNCRYCMTMSPNSDKKPRGNELSTMEVKRLVIDEVRKYCSGTAVGYSGG